MLGYEPQVDLARGLAELSVWLKPRILPGDVPDASAELMERGVDRMKANVATSRPS